MPIYLRIGSFCSYAGNFILILILFSGCGGDGLPRQAISGSISINGKPLKSGVVNFVPQSAEIPTQSGAAIIDGKYNIPKSTGLVPGKYKVVISSGEGSAEKKVDKVSDLPGMAPIPAKEAIPPEYNNNTSLEANVAAGGSNVFEFNLATKP
jgi:hypothetical protein